VQCRECAAELPAFREFCPHCGTPTKRGLRGHRPGGPFERTEDELKRNRRKVLIIGAALLLTTGIVGKISWFGASIDHDPPERPRGAAVVQAQQLFQAYRDDADAADALYGGREMIVTGEFVRIAPDGHGDPDLRLRTSDPEAPLSVDLIRAAHDQATQLRPGQTVTVSCAHVDRTGEERWLRNCAIQPVKEGGESPSPPAAPASPAAPSAPAAPEG
jgi:hypothetical protein